MNRILYEAKELQGSQLTFADARATHIHTVLKPDLGATLKTGEIDGPLSTGRVVSLSEGQVVLEIEAGEMPTRVSRDLILALPRPKVLNRLLPQIAALGVDRLILCNAARVERYYFDSHVLKPDCLRAGLIEGLVQAGDTRLPEVHVVRQLRHFVEDDLAGFCSDATRWLLHPYGSTPLMQTETTSSRIVLAIGPEGGWQDYELAYFEQTGFTRVGMMSRILRSDTACVAALSAVAMRQEAG